VIDLRHKLYDLSKLQEIAQGDEAFVRDMLETFVSNVADDVGKMQTFLRVKDWASIASIAHKLVSRFAYLNASELQELSIDVENSIQIDNNLTGIDEKADKLCKESIVLIEKLKEDFSFLSKSVEV